MRRDGRMAELVDAPDSKSSSSNAVWVRFPLRPPKKTRDKRPKKGCFLFYWILFML